MLEAQKVIEQIEAEAAKQIPKATMAQFRSRHFGAEDFTSVDGRFITAVSAITRDPAQDWR